MKARNKFSVIALAVGLSAGIAFAAATGDRLKTPVQVGQGTAVTEKIVFDLGSGSTNPFIQSTSGGTVQLSNNGTNLMSVPSATDTIVGKATTDTLTNKTLTSTSNVYRAASVSQDGAVTTGTQSFVGVKTFTSAIGETFTITGSHASGNGTRMDILNSSTGQDLIISAGSGNQSPLIATTTADNLVLQTNSVTQLTVKNGGGVTIANTGGNTPHACAAATAVCSSATTCLKTCSAGQIVTGGGCSEGLASISLLASYPTGTSTWNCSYNSAPAAITVYAMCCDY